MVLKLRYQMDSRQVNLYNQAYDASAKVMALPQQRKYEGLNLKYYLRALGLAKALFYGDD
jgi:hypothetical protein